MKVKTKFEIIPRCKEEVFDSFKGKFVFRVRPTEYMISITYPKELEDRVVELVYEYLSLSYCPDLSEENGIVAHIDTWEDGINKDDAKEEYRRFKEALKGV